jgi:hypothetical protein
MIAYFTVELEPLATLRRFPNCKIAIYADDQNPPHFHIEGRGFRAIVEMETLVVRAGEIRAAADATAWASLNQSLLRIEWLRLNRRR